MASAKDRYCLCVVSLIATTAEEDGIISCHKERGGSAGAVAPVAQGVGAKAGVGVGVECFNQFDLPEGED